MSEKQTGAKEFLQRYQKVNKAYNRKFDEIAELRALLTGTTQDASSEHVQSTKDPDKFTDIIFKIDEKEHQADKLVDKLCDIGGQVQRAIAHVGNKQAREVLTLRYIADCSFEVIAVKMGIVYSWAINLHGFGLKDVENFIKSP